MIVAAAMLLAYAGCKKNAASGPSAKPVIGCSLYDMKQEFFQKMEKGTRERALELGYGFHLHDQKGDELQMVSGLQEPSKPRRGRIDRQPVQARRPGRRSSMRPSKPACRWLLTTSAAGAPTTTRL